LTAETFEVSTGRNFVLPETEVRLTSDPELKANDFYKNRPFELAFHSSLARILDFLIAYREFDYSEAEIARKTSLAYKTVTKAISSLLEQGLIKENRTMGRSVMYKIGDTDRAQTLIQFFDLTLKSRIEKS
jgi:DNA-binding transcriptional ArsR family regulator